MKIMRPFFVMLAMSAAFTLCSIPFHAVSEAAVAAPAKAKAKAAKKANKPVKGKQHGIPRTAPPAAPAQ